MRKSIFLVLVLSLWFAVPSWAVPATAEVDLVVRPPSFFERALPFQQTWALSETPLFFTFQEPEQLRGLRVPVPREGSITIRFEETGDPNMAQMTVLALNQVIPNITIPNPDGGPPLQTGPISATLLSAPAPGFIDKTSRIFTLPSNVLVDAPLFGSLGEGPKLVSTIDMGQIDADGGLRDNSEAIVTLAALLLVLAAGNTGDVIVDHTFDVCTPTRISTGAATFVTACTATPAANATCTIDNRGGVGGVLVHCQAAGRNRVVNINIRFNPGGNSDQSVFCQ